MLQPVQLFKILSDETRLAIVMILRESGELCVCDICATISESQPTYRHGQLRQSQRPGSVCERMCVNGWINHPAPPVEKRKHIYIIIYNGV